MFRYLHVIWDSYHLVPNKISPGSEIYALRHIKHRVRFIRAIGIFLSPFGYCRSTFFNFIAFIIIYDNFNTTICCYAIYLYYTWLSITCVQYIITVIAFFTVLRKYNKKALTIFLKTQKWIKILLHDRWSFLI